MDIKPIRTTAAAVLTTVNLHVPAEAAVTMRRFVCTIDPTPVVECFPARFGTHPPAPQGEKTTTVIANATLTATSGGATGTITLPGLKVSGHGITHPR